MPNDYIQHRGLRSKQEFPNSFEALKETHGITLEIDLFYIDSQLVIMHNDDVFMLNDGEVKTQLGHLSQEEVEVLTWDQIENLYVTGRVTGKEGQHVPLLRDYIMETIHHKDSLEIEIKGSTIEKVETLAEATVREIHRMRVVGLFQNTPNVISQTVSLYSLSPEALETVQRVCAEVEENIPYGLAWVSSDTYAKEKTISKSVIKRVGWKKGGTEEEWMLAGVALATELGCTYFSTHHEAITESIVEAAHANNMEIHAWVVNDHQEAVDLLKMGVDRIITEK